MSLRIFCIEKSFKFAANLLVMDKKIKPNVDAWLHGNYDKGTKEKIKRLKKNNPDELFDAFYKSLEFGTGGLRGIMGVGTNRMNKYTVGAATQGLANYLKATYKNTKLKVAVAFDSRNNSAYFANITADVLSANRIECFLFEEMRPTPLLSFAVRYLECHAGVVITASHNPKEYNGYKAYWGDGGQLVPPHDNNVINQVNKVKSIEKIRWERKDAYVKIIGPEVDEAYLQSVEKLSLNQGAISKCADFKIVYTSLHGTGITMVPKALNRFGFQNVILEEKQCVPDENFPTVKSPNPEEKSALELSMKLADEIDADLVLATDPDADRVGIAARNRKGELILFNGNMVATMLTHYLLSEWQKQKKLSDNEFVVKTIVTTDIINKIALDFNVKCYDVLTGFKYIAETIKLNDNKKKFICGGEESYGFLIDDFVRDKDAVSACCLIAEIAAVMKNKGKTLQDYLNDIYLKYGFYKEEQLSIVKTGKNGLFEISKMMTHLREKFPKKINKSKVVKIVDYFFGKGYDFENSTFFDTNLPISDVIQFFTADGSKVTIRPSGTEPKIKFYFSVNEKIVSKEQYADMEQLLAKRIEDIIVSLKFK